MQSPSSPPEKVFNEYDYFRKTDVERQKLIKELTPSQIASAFLEIFGYNFTGFLKDYVEVFLEKSGDPFFELLNTNPNIFKKVFFEHYLKSDQYDFRKSETKYPNKRMSAVQQLQLLAKYSSLFADLKDLKKHLHDGNINLYELAKENKEGAQILLSNELLSAALSQHEWETLNVASSKKDIKPADQARVSYIRNLEFLNDDLKMLVNEMKLFFNYHIDSKDEKYYQPIKDYLEKINQFLNSTSDVFKLVQESITMIKNLHKIMQDTFNSKKTLSIKHQSIKNWLELQISSLLKLTDYLEKINKAKPIRYVIQDEKKDEALSYTANSFGMHRQSFLTADVDPKPDSSRSKNKILFFLYS